MSVSVDVVSDTASWIQSKIPDPAAVQGFVEKLASDEKVSGIFERHKSLSRLSLIYAAS